MNSENEMMDGVALIAAERQRQVSVEGWTTAHDDQYRHAELARAAACYALQTWGNAHNVTDRTHIWPWQESWWKPTDNLRNLAKAGALIAAEIDRLQRAGAPPVGHEPPPDDIGPYPHGWDNYRDSSCLIADLVGADPVFGAKNESE